MTETPTRARLGVYDLEWTSEHLRVTMRGSPWADALVLGGGLGGGIMMMPLFGWAIGWKQGWQVALFVLPLALFLGWLGYRSGAARKRFALEAFLKGQRSVWIRLGGTPVMVPAADIVEFRTNALESEISTFYGVQVKTREGSLDLLPSNVSTPKPFCDALCGILDALVLGQGTTSEALALAKDVRTMEWKWIVGMLVVVAGLVGWIVYVLVNM